MPDNNPENSTDYNLIKLAVLTALSALILFPCFSLVGNGFLFKSASALHFFCLIALFALSLIYIRNLFTNRLLGLLYSCLPFLLILPDLMLPVNYKDALIHHLFVPAFWQKAGYALELKWHSWSYYPMLLQTAYINFLPNIEQLCAVYQALYLWPLAAFAVLIYKCIDDNRVGYILVTVFLLFTPVCLQLAGAPMVDLALAFFCELAILVFLQASKYRSVALLLGISLAAVLSTKYNGLVFLIAFICFVFYQYKQLGFKYTLALITVALISATMLYLPWPIRNYLLIGNPFYPLFNSLFGVAAENTEKLPVLGPWAQRVFLYKESLLELILLPIRMIFLGEEGNPRRFDGVASPLIILFLLPAFYRNQDSKVKSLYILTFVYIAISLYMGPARIRYLAPVFGVVAILAAYGFVLIAKHFKSNANLVFAFVILLQITWGAWHKINIINYSNALNYIAGSLTNATYLSKKHIEYDMVQKINQSLDDSNCVYALYTANTFYWYNGCVQSDGYHSARRLLTWIKQSSTSAELANSLTKSGLTHLFWNSRRLQGFLESNLNEQQLLLWQEFLEKHCAEKFAKKGYYFCGVG